KLRALTVLTGIWGVGPSTAKELLAKGFRSIQEVRERGRHLLNQRQLIGLDRQGWGHRG
ncbi:unnamed protein product, partial [Discosporangium mesarthrocarpum]